MVMWYKSVSFWKQALVTLAAATGMFNWGTVLGWSNIANPQLRSKETGFGMGDEGSSWIGSTVPFGGIVGSLFGGTMMDMVGRKRSLIFAHFVGLVGWITIALAQSVWVICVGRFFCGYSSATTALVATVYVGEVVISEHRGLFCSCLACAVSIGIQFVVAIGSIIPTWQMTTVVCMIPVLIGITILPFMPESPYFLAWKSGNVEDARPSLNWILHHKTEKVETTLEDIGEYLQTVHQEEANSKQNKNENDEDAGNHEKDLKSDEFQIDSPQPKRGKFSKLNLFEIKMILIGSVLMMFSRINGVSSLDYFMIEIFDVSCMKFNYNLSAIIVRGVELLSTIMALYLTDRLGRKLLLLLSALGMSVGMIVLGIGFSVIDENKKVSSVELSYLPLIGMIIFYFSFPIGFHSVIIVLLGELFPPSVKGVATSLSTLIMWSSEFITAKIYFDYAKFLGYDGTFYLYASFSLVAAVFVQFFVRETKNKTLAEIQETYKAE